MSGSQIQNILFRLSEKGETSQNSTNTVYDVQPVTAVTWSMLVNKGHKINLTYFSPPKKILAQVLGEYKPCS